MSTPQDPRQQPTGDSDPSTQAPGPWSGGSGQGHQMPPPGRQVPPMSQPASGQFGPPSGQQFPPQGQSGFGTASALPGGGSGQGADAKSFFAALFDWRFHTLITPKIVSIVYLIGMVLIGLYLLAFLVFSFSTGEPLVAVFMLIVGPVAALIALAFWRMTLEFYFAVVRMSDDIHRSNGAPRP